MNAPRVRLRPSQQSCSTCAGRSSVRRARIRERLERSLEHPLTLVCAPVGYVKTTLFSDWLAGSGYRYIWLSLNESDNNLAIFLNYFVTTIRTVYPQACTNTLGLLAAPHLPPPTRLATALANDLEALPCQPGPADGRCCILVLDDYHLMRNEAISALLGEIWRHPPRTMHLILSTRQDPSLPLDVLRARGELSEIREAPQQQHLPRAPCRRPPRCRCQGGGVRARVCCALSQPPDAA